LSKAFQELVCFLVIHSVLYDILPGLLYDNYLNQGKSPEQELKWCTSKHIGLEQQTGPISCPSPKIMLPLTMSIWDTVLEQFIDRNTSNSKDGQYPHPSISFCTPQSTQWEKNKGKLNVKFPYFVRALLLHKFFSKKGRMFSTQPKFMFKSHRHCYCHNLCSI